MKKHYIKAVVDVLIKNPDVDAVLENLKRVLASKGHSQLYPTILMGVLNALNINEKETNARIIVAKEVDREKLSKAIVKSLHDLGTDGSNTTIETDPTLIGGYVTLFKGKSVDASYKAKLVKLYRSITA